MARVKLRSRREVVGRARSLTTSLHDALERLPEDEGDPDVSEAIWAGEGLGTLLWALQRAQLPPYDRPFRHEALLAASLDGAALRPAAEIDQAREVARLWHWRARTAALQRRADVDLPSQWLSFDQLVGATAMRAHERGLLPSPVRGDFPAFGTGYRALTAGQRAEAHQIAWQRHRALNWLCGLGRGWDAVPTDT
ncbi:MAG TPA: hypothetical protein VH721_09075 [Gaiellaceae bacterium]|jgi:hypothetical protein